MRDISIASSTATGFGCDATGCEPSQMPAIATSAAHQGLAARMARPCLIGIARKRFER
jgi:hypothetical protein